MSNSPEHRNRNIKIALTTLGVTALGTAGVITAVRGLVEQQPKQDASAASPLGKDPDRNIVGGAEYTVTPYPTATKEPTRTPTPVPPTATATQEATPTPEMPLERYAVYSGEAKEEDGKNRMAIIISYLPDMPDQANKLLVFYIKGNPGTGGGGNYNGILLNPQNIQNADFMATLSQSTLQATLESPTKLSGRVKFPWEKNELILNATLKGSGQNALLDEIGRQMRVEFRYTQAGPSTSREKMLNDLTKFRIKLP